MRARIFGTRGRIVQSVIGSAYKYTCLAHVRGGRRLVESQNGPLFESITLDSGKAPRRMRPQKRIRAPGVDDQLFCFFLA